MSGVTQHLPLKTVSFKGSRVRFVAMSGQIAQLHEMGLGRLAFSRWEPGSGNDIWTMSPDGSGQVLASTSGDGYDPSWSPDGKFIVFVKFSDLYIIDVEKDTVKQLTKTPHEEWDPDWQCRPVPYPHPEGGYIAYSASYYASHMQVFETPANGFSKHLLTPESPGDDVQPAWSPDYRFVAYANNTGGVYNIRLLSTGSLTQTALTGETTVGADNTEPAWSPDGLKIAFCSKRDTIQQGVTTSRLSRIYVMNADGSEQRRVTPLERGVLTEDFSPTWSPDGRKIAFSITADGTPAGICTINADGTGLARLSNEQDTKPDWSWAPWTKRTLVGGFDCGSYLPPFGNEQVVVVIGLDDGGMVSATGFFLTDPTGLPFPSLQVAAIPNALGVRITGATPHKVLEDMGCGQDPVEWEIPDPQAFAYGLLVFFSGETGRVTSVMAPYYNTTSGSAPEAVAETVGGRTVVRGPFQAVFAASQPGRNLAPAQQVVLDRKTGEFLRAE